jgi:hypothetical protein
VDFFGFEKVGQPIQSRLSGDVTDSKVYGSALASTADSAHHEDFPFLQHADRVLSSAYIQTSGRRPSASGLELATVQRIYCKKIVTLANCFGIGRGRFAAHVPCHGWRSDMLQAG